MSVGGMGKIIFGWMWCSQLSQDLQQQHCLRNVSCLQLCARVRAMNVIMSQPPHACMVSAILSCRYHVMNMVIEIAELILWICSLYNQFITRLNHCLYCIYCNWLIVPEISIFLLSLSLVFIIIKDTSYNYFCDLFQNYSSWITVT